MKKIKYYLKKLINKFNNIFSSKRIKKYGLALALYDLLIFLMHRNDSKLEHFLIRKKDKIVQKYIYTNHKDILIEVLGDLNEQS